MGAAASGSVRSRAWRLWWTSVLCLSLGVVLLVVVPPTPASAAACDAPVVNEVACENTKPGNAATEWDVSGSGSSSIQGFATDISVNRGTTIGFKVKTTATSYRMDIYRMGYYGGKGARKITTLNVSGATTQLDCRTESATGLVDCGNWTQTASWAVPGDAVSGVYFGKLVAGTAASHIMFIVRNDASRSALLFQTSDTTWQAYNTYGGNSLYVGSPAGRAYKVSYNRPFVTRAGETEHDWVFNAEYPAIRFMEANGYDLSYTTGVDSARNGALIKNHRTFLSVGHDEYWSGDQRANVEAARDAGVNLAFFSGNEVFWKTRWENSLSTAGNTPYRTLVTYKETLGSKKFDPIGSGVWTGTWRDPRFSPPADGGRPENALTGTSFAANCCTTDMTVNGVDGQMRFWRGTRVASLSASQSTTLGSGILGYEWDESPDNGARPAGAISLSTTTRSADYLQDYGSSYAPGTATHHLTMYRAASRALVFGAGSVQWSWGLDSTHALGTGTADTAVQQATVNLFADLGAQPATLQAGLSAAGASTDTTAPTSVVSSPAQGATVAVGTPLTISGSATDVGGKVGGVEVSTDNGGTWHPANGRGSWAYTFTPGANGTLTIRTRATDDSLRTESPSTGRTITVGNGGGTGGTCPCTLFAPTATPAVPADPDGTANELGVKFSSSQAGSVTGVRFYKGASNTGTHVGSLWSATGTRLASATFTESASGWQQASFASPVPVTAGTTYVASYFAPNGHYAATDGYFSSPLANPPLTAPAETASAPNGVFRAGSTGFPNQGYSASNYWVDVVFSTAPPAPDTTPPTVTARTPASGATGVGTSSTVTATFSETVQSGTAALTLSGPAGSVSGTLAYSTTSRTATFTPGASLATSTTYTATASGAKDTAGNTMNPSSWTFTTAAQAPTDTTPPTVTARTPASGATGVVVGTTVTATFSEALAGTPTVVVTGPAGAVSGSLAYDATARRATFTPGSALSPSTAYTATVSGATDTAGNAMAPASWTFTTAAASSSGCPCTIWPSTATPAVSAEPDPDGVEVGVKFRAGQSGTVTAIRFYKGAGNTGTHTGSLWSRTGTRLGTATFSAESASGWQQATFSTPVAVTAGTTYVASYFAPAGHYAVTEGYFTAATTRGPLTALQNGTDGANGVYRYGATSGFPTSSYQSSNYWVDVVFVTS